MRRRSYALLCTSILLLGVGLGTASTSACHGDEDTVVKDTFSHACNTDADCTLALLD